MYKQKRISDKAVFIIEIVFTVTCNNEQTALTNRLFSHVTILHKSVKNRKWELVDLSAKQYHLRVAKKGDNAATDIYDENIEPFCRARR